MSKEDNGAYKSYGTNRTSGASGAQQRKPLEPQPFLPKKGNYRGLIVYQKAECIYDITFYFAHHYFVERKDRTIDQVVQAARSAKQNIAEGSAAASTSAETEIKLIGVVGSVVVHGFSCSAAYGILPDWELNPCPLYW